MAFVIDDLKRSELYASIMDIGTMITELVPIASLGWLGLYSDMSKVGNVNLPGLEIDKHDEISG